MPMINSLQVETNNVILIENNDIDKAINLSAYKSEDKITKGVVIINQSKFESLKMALNYIGVTGMTVTQVLGCGVQKGNTEYYRGVEMEINLLPKVKVEIVVSKIPVRKVIKAVKSFMHTGKIGDGKIFIYDIDNAIKIRTGEEGFDALQNND